MESLPADLYLFGEPRIRAGDTMRPVPDGAKRLVAYLALGGGRVTRRQAAGVLWPAGNDLRATGNLRSALWRLRAAGLDPIGADKEWVWLRPGLTVDTNLMTRWADDLRRGVSTDTDELFWPHCRDGLLPGWNDNWVGPHRERLRQRLLHAMETLARRLLAGGDPGRAGTVARRVIDAEPLRESTYRILAEALQHSGRTTEARHTYAVFRNAAGARFGPAAGSSIRRLFAQP
jgi:DNA-binding SARP family transcriptional activator